MSIECFPFDVSRCSLQRGTRRRRVSGQDAAAAGTGPGTGPRTGRPTSQRRIDANRRNAQRSTGPRTPQGKKRSSRNALKHGLCARFSHLPSECGATFSIFVEELREQLQPRSIMQKTLFPQIVDLIWRMNRMPETQTKIFEQELEKAHRPGDSTAPLASSEVLARRFSDDPNRNGFLQLGRYERGMQNQLLRLLRQYERETKLRPQTPHDPDEAPIPREGDAPAWTPQKTEPQRRFSESTQGQVPARGRAGSPDDSPAGDADTKRLGREPAARAERSQSNPPQNATGASETSNSSPPPLAPVTERSHLGGDEATPARFANDDPAAEPLLLSE